MGSGGTVAFRANYDAGRKTGIFTTNGSELNAVVKTGDVVPGYSTLIGPSIPSMSGDTVAFMAVGFFEREGQQPVELIAQHLDLYPHYNPHYGPFLTVGRFGFSGSRLAFNFSYQGGITTSSIGVFHLNHSPEPATIAMLSLAILAVGGFARRRSSQGVTKRAPEFRSRSGSIARRRLAVESWIASALVCSGCLFGLSTPAAHAQPLDLQWVRQLGTPDAEINHGVSADRLGNVFIVGGTTGSLGGPFQGGWYDAFVGKYGPGGNLEWVKQIATDKYDECSGVSADGLGNVFISGFIGLGEDAFVAKYDSAGVLLWNRQFEGFQEGKRLTTDGLGNVYVAGEKPFYDATIRKYDSAGNLQWTRQLDLGGLELITDTAADELGNMYLTGYSDTGPGPPGGGPSDAFVSKYDALGNLQWTTFFDSSFRDISFGVSPDGLGNVLIAGTSDANTEPPNPSNAFVNKYDAAGNLQWTRQFGTSGADVSADGFGNIYVAAFAPGPVIRKFDALGNHRWTQNLGEIKGLISVDGRGGLFVSGTTTGSVGGPNAGGNDVYVAKYYDRTIPEPATAAMVGLALLAVGGYVRRRNTGSATKRASASRTRSRSIARRRLAVTSWVASALVCAGFVFGIAAPPAHAQTLEWVRQLGTSSSEFTSDIAADGLGNLYIAGYTSGNLGGPHLGGTYDVFLGKYNENGNLEWVRQFGGETNDFSHQVSADRLGNVYITGYSSESFFLSKFDSAGILQWSKRPDHFSWEGGGVAADALCNVYISGRSLANDNAILAKYDDAGNFQWNSELELGAQGIGDAVSTDGLGNVYIAGSSGSLIPPRHGPSDIFLSKFDTDGNLAWTNVVNLSLLDTTAGVSTDGLGNVYIAGTGNSQLPGPGYLRALVNKYDAAGSLQWTSQFEGYALDLSADLLGSVYLSGWAGGQFLRKFDPAGNPRWSQALPEPSLVSTDGLRNVYVAGTTDSSPGDAFVAKYNDFTIPEPASWLLAAGACAGILCIGARRRSLIRTAMLAVPFWIGSLLLVAPAFGETITVKVPGTSNPWLTGMPADSTAIISDVAPAQSPVHVSGDFAQPTLSFAATGLVTNGGCGLPYCPTNGPDGGETPERPYFPHDNGAENGISDARIPLNALVGVFLDASQPNLTPAPSPLDFSTPASRDYLSVSPGLKQVFFIGDGLTSTGETRQVLIPAGATRLFLGTMDGCCNSDNSGSFTVHVSGIIPEPAAWLFAVVAAGLLGMRGKKSGTMSYLFAAALAIFVLFPAPTVQAEILDGQIVRTRIVAPFPHGLTGPDISVDSTVGPGTEIMSDIFHLDVDLSDSNILITNRNLGDAVYFAQIEFKDAFGTIPRFTSVNVNPASTWPGYTSSTDISFNANSIFLFLVPSEGSNGQQLSLDLTAMIPEPATWVLAAVSVMLLGMRRKKSRTMPCLFAAGLALVILAATPPVQAEILHGQTIRTEYREHWPHGLPGPHYILDRVVGPGTEIVGSFYNLDIDFSDANILITNKVDQAIGEVVVEFSDLYNAIPRFTAVTFNPATTWLGYTPGTQFTPSPNKIFLYLRTPEGAQIKAGERISLDLEAMIPEPASWQLAALAAAVLGTAICVRNKRAFIRAGRLSRTISATAIVSLCSASTLHASMISTFPAFAARTMENSILEPYPFGQTFVPTPGTLFLTSFTFYVRPESQTAPVTFSLYQSNGIEFTSPLFTGTPTSTLYQEPPKPGISTDFLEVRMPTGMLPVVPGLSYFATIATPKVDGFLIPILCATTDCASSLYPDGTLNVFQYSGLVFPQRGDAAFTAEFVGGEDRIYGTIPEPATIAMFALALLAMSGCVRRKPKREQQHCLRDNMK
jgi:hypothetical protein